MNPIIPFASNVLMPLFPMILISITTAVVMIAIAMKRSNFVAGTLSVIGLNAALVVVLIQLLGGNPDSILHGLYQLFTPSQGLIAPLFVVDSFAQFNMVIILISSLACFTLAYGYIGGYGDNKEELYLLLLISTLGALFMVCADNLASFFVSLELLSVPLYGMLAYTYERGKSLEAGFKYLILSATASATMLMGMALIYSNTGTLSFRQIGMAIVPMFQNGIVMPILVVGTALMLFGIAFKLSAVPFHTWTPDVYQGAPAPVATFLGSVSKVAMMALGLRFLLSTATLALPAVNTLIVVIASLSMIIGNVLALRQQNIKRLLAYSSIAHIGYVLAIISAVKVESAGFVSLYMAVYAFTTIGAFGVVTIMSSPYKRQGEAELVDNFQGIFWQRPVLTAVLTVMLLSLAGIPLTAGFISKFFAIFATVSAQSWWLTAMIIVGSAISLYYYLNLMVTLFRRPQAVQPHDAVNHWGVQAGGIMVLLVTLAVLYFGIFPETLSKIITLVRIY